MPLVNHVIQHIKPREYFESVLANQMPIDWPDSDEGNVDVSCPFHGNPHTTPLSISPSGKFYCHSCAEGGNTVVTFHSKLHGITLHQAAIELYGSYVHPIIAASKIDEMHKALIATPAMLDYVCKNRMVNRKVVDHLKIGLLGTRIVFPIRNEYSLYVNAKLYEPLAKKKGVPKTINWTDPAKKEKRSFGSPVMLFPLEIMEWARVQGYVVICEGEFDTCVLLSMGIPAITGTLGSKAWPSQYNPMFRGMKVYFCYDSDEEDKHGKQAGEEGVKIVSQQLREVASEIHRITVPQKFAGGHTGKDVTDWVRYDKTMRTQASWKQVMAGSPLIFRNAPPATSSVDRVSVSLSEAAKAEHFGKPLHLSCMVTGKDLSPYMLPSKCRVSCGKAQLCDKCPLATSGQAHIDIDLDPRDPEILRLINAPESTMHKHVLEKAGIFVAKCRGKVEVSKMFNVEELILTPTIDQHNPSAGPYVLRTGYYVGHGTIPNRAYKFDGLTVAHPEDQHATHLLLKKYAVQDEIETFKMTPKLQRDLAIFHPTTKMNMLATFMAITEWQSTHITKIKDRPDVHIAVDLAYHSVASFEFNDEVVARGMMDILIIGDTRTGKGYITERLTKFYGMGEVASGENCSFAGLIGGLQQVNKRWIVTWGIIPMNNNRLVVIDETSSMTEKEIGHMSRVRSEGVAEINKIMREQTNANTRLIWLSNTRSGRSIRTYASGAEAIIELMGAHEDVSRFDYALTTSKDEISADIINAPSHYSGRDKDKYPQALCRALLLWAWSRRRDQVQFTPAAISAILSEAISLGSKYSSDIPLVQSENIRIKLAKIAAACAARTFSSPDGERLLVTQEHVEFAVWFLNWIYEKPSMGYNQFSKGSHALRTVDIPEVERCLKDMGAVEKMTVRGLLEIDRITADNLADFVGDALTARTFIGDLVRIKCLTRDGREYMKTPAFMQWLRKRDAKKVSTK